MDAGYNKYRKNPPIHYINIFANPIVKITSHKLRIRLLEEGYFEYKCSCCGLTEWLGQPIPLELHHKDFDHYNNNLDNL